MMNEFKTASLPDSPYRRGYKKQTSKEASCLTCGYEFTIVNKGQKYCSRECFANRPTTHYSTLTPKTTVRKEEKLLFKNLGYGDAKKGLEVLNAIVNRLHYARQQHGPEEWLKGGEEYAFKALMSEASECCVARTETPKEERIKSELLDLIVVAIRIYNGEHESIDE